MKMTAKAKHLLRTILKNGVTFFAVAFIAGTSIAYFQGLQSAGVAVLERADRYFIENKLETLQARCANGITREDIDAIAQWEGVTAVEGGYSASLTMALEGERTLVQAHSLLEQMNVPVIVAGALPAAADEVAIEELLAKEKGLRVGDTLTLEHTGQLHGETFRITAIINEPSYCCASISDARGTGDVGYGANEYYIELPLAAFDASYFSDCYTTAHIASSAMDGVYYFSAAYEEQEAAYLATLADAAQARAQLRYESLLADVQGKIDEGQQKLDAALAEIEPHEWVLSGRNDIGDVRGVETIVEGLMGLSYSLSFIFVLVGIVICYASITRMIDEQRTLIGAQKALGFKPREILTHYLIYNMLCSLLGTLMGSLASVYFVELTVLVIFSPKLVLGSIPLSFSWGTGWICAALCMAVFVIAVFISCLKLVKLPATTLLQGQLPTNGKHHFFEKWPAYQRLSLYTRSMIKNVLHDKGRMFTTIMGVVGCTSLLVASFTAKINMDNASVHHFNNFFLYENRLVVDTSAGQTENFAAVLEDEGIEYALVQDKLERFRVDGGQWNTMHVVAADAPETLDGFMHLQDMAGNTLRMPEDGVLVSHKCAETYGLEAGSVIEWMDADGKAQSCRVAGVIEHYLTYHLFVTSSSYYESALGKAPDRCVFLLKGDVAGLREKVAGLPGFLSLQDNSALATSGSTMNLVIAISVALSAAMALLVNLNQITMHINRKARELAVMRINGYSVKEAKAYVYKDNIIITGIGLLLGSVAGIGMAYMVVRFIETGAYRYLRTPSLTACLLAVAISALFALLVNLLALRRINKLNLTSVNAN